MTLTAQRIYTEEHIMNTMIKPILTTFVMALAFTGSAFAADMASPPNSLVVTDSGNVGVGTPTPASTLEVNQTDAKIRVVEADNTTDKLRTLFTLNNYGPPGLLFQDTSSGGKVWNFRGSTSGRFSISETTSGVTEAMFVPGGNLIIAGNLTANGTLYTSSRALKDEIAPVDSALILEKIAALPISEWSYKKDEGKVRHIGPMSEDFNAAFGMKGSSDDRISSIDMSGITLAAVKELNEVMNEKNREIAILKDRLANLENMLSKLVANDQVAAVAMVQ